MFTEKNPIIYAGRAGDHGRSSQRGPWVLGLQSEMF